ncbi:MAG: tyrosine-type recombinase/integrase [Deltaproteobacteria bacterium]|nr:tyrosine-type recombinase/integrase [Deltaproteobacteria bacterium]
MDLLGKEQVESYLRHVARRNYKPSTLYGILTALELFLGVVRDAGKTRLADITRDDVEAFIEHEQDRGVKITSVRTRLVLVQTFLGYGIDGGFISPSVFGRRIRLQLPACLPRAMEPDDVQRLLAVVDLTRDRAMMLVLLRTGMRIGELLATKMTEVHLRERRIEIYEGEKNRLGRVVYLSDDAVSAVKAWLNARDSRSGYLIHGRRSMRLCYSAARSRFEKYLTTAGLTHKGYTLHSLRHTFASELLNAGMRLECLQVLLGHQSIQETRRYARLTDTTREEEYFRAMSIIERGEINGHYRRDHELAAFPETEELCT